MAVQPGLCPTWPEILKIGFLFMRLIYQSFVDISEASVVCLEPLAYSLPMLRRPSVVSRLPPFLKIFSETAWPIKTKFHVESPRGRGKIACINGRGHMTKVAAAPII